jgi:hypothetical protein
MHFLLELVSWCRALAIFFVFACIGNITCTESGSFLGVMSATTQTQTLERIDRAFVSADWDALHPHQNLQPLSSPTMHLCCYQLTAPSSATRDLSSDSSGHTAPVSWMRSIWHGDSHSEMPAPSNAWIGCSAIQRECCKVGVIDSLVMCGYSWKSSKGYN